MQVAANLIGVPQRADWRACKETKDEETAMVEAMKAKFAPFDIMQ